jgi:hypothetical protein
MPGLFQRLQDQQRAAIEITVDGDRLQVLEGDTLLTAILTHRPHLRLHEIGDEPRSGFCLMGACQDCWVSDAAGNRLRACTTYVHAGLEIATGLAAAVMNTGAGASPTSAPATREAPADRASTGKSPEKDAAEPVADESPAPMAGPDPEEGRP